MEPAPNEVTNFMVIFGEIMSDMYGSEELYEVDLRKIFRELSSLYWKWTRDLMLAKIVISYFDELSRLQFMAKEIIYENIINRSSKLVQNLNRLFFIDTTELNVAIEEAKRRKMIAERRFKDEGKHEEGIQLMKNVVDDFFKVYSNWKAMKSNLERNALKKWGGVIGGIYTLTMTIYFCILNYMQIKPNYSLGYVVPSSVAILLLLLLIAIYSPMED